MHIFSGDALVLRYRKGMLGSQREEVLSLRINIIWKWYTHSHDTDLKDMSLQEQTHRAGNRIVYRLYWRTNYCRRNQIESLSPLLSRESGSNHYGISFLDFYSAYSTTKTQEIHYVGSSCLSNGQLGKSSINQSDAKFSLPN